MLLHAIALYTVVYEQYMNKEGQFLYLIPEQFIVKAQPALFVGSGRGAKKWGTVILVYSWHTLPKRAQNIIPVYSWHKLLKKRTKHTKTVKARTLCVYLQAAPYLMYKQSEPGRRLTGNDRYDGYLVDLTRLLSRIVGFEYEFREVKDGRYGMKNPDGTWNGMIGELTRRVCYQKISKLIHILSIPIIQ